MEPVFPGGCAHQALPRATVVLEAATWGVTLVETGISEEEKEDLLAA